MTWIIIVGIFLLAFVPLVYAIPSSRQRRQARLRKRATSDGVRVEVMYIPKMSADASEMVNAAGKILDPKIECAAYQLLLPKPIDLPNLLLLKISNENKGSIFKVLDGWGVRNQHEMECFRDHTDLVKLIEVSVASLPDDVLAFEFTRNKVSLLWRENDELEEHYSKILETLKTLKEHHTGRENRSDFD